MRGQLTKETRLEISVTRLRKSVEALRLTIKELVKTGKEKDRAIAALEKKLIDKEGQRKELLTYLYKPGNKNTDKKPLGKKKGAKGYHRPIPKESDITAERVYALKRCPNCKSAVGKGVDEVTKYVEDITLVPHNTVTKHIITRHWCPECACFVKSKDIPPISRIGVNALGYILYARYRLRLPMQKIKESLLDLHSFRISEGEIAEKLKDAEELFGKDHDLIVALIQDATVVYADETGWRMNGDNWFLWVFVTDKAIRYVIEDTRGKGVAARALGEKIDRVLISDGYTAYQNLPGDKQQCWVHLLRAAKLRSGTCYGKLALLYHQLLIELEKPIAERNSDALTKTFGLLIDKKYPEPEADKVIKRMIRDRTALFTCLQYDGVLPENNTAERAIRPQVIMRKIFGGSRSLAGASAHAVNTSVLATLAKQHPGENFMGALLPLLEKRCSGL
jgi:transposase